MKTTAKKLGDQYMVGPQTQKLRDQSPPVPTVVAPMQGRSTMDLNIRWLKASENSENTSVRHVIQHMYYRPCRLKYFNSTQKIGRQTNLNSCKLWWGPYCWIYCTFTSESDDERVLKTGTQLPKSKVTSFPAPLCLRTSRRCTNPILFILLFHFHSQWPVTRVFFTSPCICNQSENNQYKILITYLNPL